MRSLRAGNPRAPCLDECQVATGVSGAVGRRCSRRSGSNDAGGTAQSAGVLIDSGCISGRSIRGCYFGRVFVGSSSKSSGVVDINPTVTALCAFVGALASVAVIALLARQRAATPSVIILAGVALSSLFTSGTSLIQYFADELQIAAIVFWAFGDLGRARWPHLGVMTVVIVLALAFFVWKIWSYNALDAGEDVAQALGVNVIRLRTWTLIIGAAATAMVVSVVGVIAFVGLIVPHIVRRLVGEDYRYVLPGSALAGALVLLLADTFSRLIIAPTVLPVGAVTSFLGAPLFLMIILRQLRRKP